MASSSKKWWLATGAVSVVVAGLMILCLPKCNRVNKEQADSEQKDSVVVVDNSDRIRVLTDSINELKQDLRDTQEMLDDCRKSKPAPRKKPTPKKPTPKKPMPKKPVPQKPARPVKKDPVVVVVEKHVPAPCVNIDNSNNKGTIVVGNNNNVVVQQPVPAVVADSLERFKRTTTVTVTVKTKTRQRIYY